LTQLLVQLVTVEVVVMLALRPLIWWYFGIGRALRALESVDARLKYIGEIKDLEMRRWRRSA
jgi:hypothetical protein